MEALNIEIKARSSALDRIRGILTAAGADFKGTDHQIDTYFNVPNGRLKLREGSIENNLIHYERENKQGPKQSTVTLFKSAPESSLKQLLTKANDISTVVDKQREIYFINNVKFHLDTVQSLGTFVEIEAIDTDGSIGQERLLEQCNHYLAQFNLAEADLVSVSYSDLLRAN